MFLKIIIVRLMWFIGISFKKQPLFLTHVEWLKLPPLDYLKWVTTDSSPEPKKMVFHNHKNGYYSKFVWVERYLTFYFGYNK